jgi:DNA-directed RNA polymerase subunit RPC12/RpoP
MSPALRARFATKESRRRSPAHRSIPSFGFYGTKTMTRPWNCCLIVSHYGRIKTAPSTPSPLPHRVSRRSFPWSQNGNHGRTKRGCLDERSMRPKSYQYQIQYACFDCRKAFKRPSIVTEQERTAWLSRRISGRQPSKPFAMPEYRCPECKRLLKLMGRAFRAPRKEDADQWHKVELLARSGFTFRSSVGRYPETLAEARLFVKSHAKLSEGQRLARQIRKRTA